MADLLLPAAATLFLWWFSTGAILMLDGLPAHTFRWTMLAATVVLGGALYALAQSAGDATATGAYVAFVAALLVWAWQEIGFLTGYVTGTSRRPCPEGAAGWARFSLAVRAILYHELALIVLGLAVVALTWGQPNQIGTWTFLLLWAMRTSAKLNIFLGVRNPGEAMLPDHLRYLTSFFRRRPMNALFPISVTAGTIAAVLLIQAALAPTADAFTTVGFAMLGTIAALAVLEHWFLILPLPFEALWSWGQRPRAAPPVSIPVRP